MTPDAIWERVKGLLSLERAAVEMVQSHDALSVEIGETDGDVIQRGSSADKACEKVSLPTVLYVGTCTAYH